MRCLVCYALGLLTIPIILAGVAFLGPTKDVDAWANKQDD